MSSSRKKTTDIARPVVGVDGVNNVVRTLFAYREPTFYKDLASAANMNEVYTSQALSASRDVGLTKLAGKRGVYELTSQGEEYARLLSFGKESESRELIREILLNNPRWSEIMTFLRINEGIPRDSLDIVLEVERKLGKRWSPSMRSKIASVYSSILSYAYLIEIEKGKMVSQIGLKKLEEKAEAVPEKVERVVEKPMEPVISMEGFAEFRLPDSFIVYVRKDTAALDFFEAQIKKESMLTPWVKFVRSKIEKKNE